jgi:hypothetical protein
MKREGYSNEPGYIVVALEILQELESCAQMVGEMFSGKQAKELGIVGGPQLNICAEGLREFVAKIPERGGKKKDTIMLGERRLQLQRLHQKKADIFKGWLRKILFLQIRGWNVGMTVGAVSEIWV